MSHDLVAVQRDAALLDALAQRRWVVDPATDLDPVAGLLAALAADVDGALTDAVPAATRAIPVQRRGEDRQATVLALPAAIPVARRRHAARAAAALIVTAALLSVSGVAAAVSGDPLTPYKRVVDVVRVGYHAVVPRRVVLPKPTAALPAATAFAPRAERSVEQVRRAVGIGASRSAQDRRLWRRQQGDRAGRQRTGSARQQFGRPDRRGQTWDGRQRSGGGGFGADAGGQHRSGSRDARYGDGGSGSGRLFDAQGDGSADGRR